MRIKQYKPAFYINSFDLDKIDKYIEESFEDDTTSDFIISDDGYVRVKGIPQGKKIESVVFPETRYEYDGLKTFAAWYSLVYTYRMQYKDILKSKLGESIETVLIKKENDLWLFQDGRFDRENRIILKAQKKDIDFLPVYFWNTYERVVEHMGAQQPTSYFDNLINFSGIADTVKIHELRYKRRKFYATVSVLENDAPKEKISLFFFNLDNGEISFPSYRTIVSERSFGNVSDAKAFIRTLKRSIEN